MAQRTECLYNDEIIGIETIFTVINGKQINIPEKLKELRAKSQANQLFCPCGCGRNLVLVAGDRNLREQHFRVKDDFAGKDCEALTEGKNSIDSKIVLKCWLDEKLKYPIIRTRVPLSSVSETQRRYEYTLLAEAEAFAVSYTNERVNLSAEKIRMLTENDLSISVFFVVDMSNFGSDGQYPESIMKIQNEQGFCAFLSIQGRDNYEKARLKIAYSIQDIDGVWVEVVVAEDFLYTFAIEGRNVSYSGIQLNDLVIRSKKEYANSIEKERIARIERQKEWEEEQERRRRENERIHEEELRRLAEARKRAEDNRILQEKQLQEMREKQEQEEKERAKRDAAFYEAFLATMDFIQQDRQVIDPKRGRLIKCEFCGKIGPTADFPMYGGAKHINLGTCYDCIKEHPFKEPEKTVSKTRVQYDPLKCPVCGGQLKEKVGKFGHFWGCKNYPNCTYTRKM